MHFYHLIISQILFAIDSAIQIELWISFFYWLPHLQFFTSKVLFFDLETISPNLLPHWRARVCMCMKLIGGIHYICVWMDKENKGNRE